MLARAALVAAFILAAGQVRAADALDGLFARLGRTTPGWAVGIDRPGQPEITRAYGMSDLEHAVTDTPKTIFEAR